MLCTCAENQPTSKASTAAGSSHHKQTTSKPIAKAQNPHNLELESLVQFGDPPIYGVIKWIGILPDYGEALQAGMHMVSTYMSIVLEQKFSVTVPSEQGYKVLFVCEV